MKKRILRYIPILFIIIILACKTLQPISKETRSEPTPTFTAQPTQKPIQNTEAENLPSPNPVPSSGVLRPENLQYLGAFRLPGEDERPKTFAYGGNAMTYNPDGDQSGTKDGFPGSLFVMGHDRLPFGELPDGDQVAEVDIPQPVVSKNLQDLNTAVFIQGFRDVTKGYFTELEEIPKIGMVYLNRPETGAKIHLAWGQQIQLPDVASHAWFNVTLDDPQFKGTWFIGNQDLYRVNGYMFEIPQTWADANTSGRLIATGRMRDGGQGGFGPALFAYRPWQADGSAPPTGTHLEETVLLLYENAYNSEEIVRNMVGYQHADEWEGGAWLTTASGKQAVLFAGTKSDGKKFWYGYRHPDGPELVCVDRHVNDYITCRSADGKACPKEDFSGCCDEESGGCISMRGWWSTHFDAQFIFYNPDDLAKVARGEIESWQPQPYASLDVDEYLFLNPPEWDVINVGAGDQRRYRIGDVAFDRRNGLLYVLEQYADGAKPLVHVWRIS